MATVARVLVFQVVDPDRPDEPLVETETLLEASKAKRARPGTIIRQARRAQYASDREKAA